MDLRVPKFAQVCHTRDPSLPMATEGETNTMPL